MLSTRADGTAADVAFDPSYIFPADSEVVVERRCALTSLLMAEKGYFLRTANRILRNEADAEDAVHSAFCSAWKAMGAFRGDASLRTWFTRVVANAALTLLRGRRNGRFVSLEEDPEVLHEFELKSASAVEDPEQIVSNRERLGVVAHHMQSLPVETRAVMLLHYGHDYPIEAIARERGKSRPAVAAHLHRGKALLRRKVLTVSFAGKRKAAVLQ